MEASDGMSASGQTRVNLSVLHLLSAAMFSRRLGELEVEHCGKEFGEFWHDILANGSGSIFTAVAAMESYANELFIDQTINFPELAKPLMEKLWELYEQKPILDKFEFALLLKGGPAIDRGASPYQDVSTLIKLRNGLIHFKPEWFSAQEEHAKLSALLQYKATRSPFFGKEESLFPLGWSSHATAKWAVRSVLAFLVEFEVRANLPVRMGKFKERFDTL